MSLAAHLIHTCTIENEKAGAVDAHNNAKKAWDVPIENVPCRFIETREQMKSDEQAEGVIQSTYMLMVLGGTDLRDRARISKITLEDGTVIAAKFNVTEMFVRRGRNSHHKTATLERVS